MCHHPDCASSIVVVNGSLDGDSDDGDYSAAPANTSPTPEFVSPGYVWGADTGDGGEEEQSGSTGSGGGVRLADNSSGSNSKPLRSWVETEENVVDMGNGRKICSTKLVPKTGGLSLGPASKTNVWGSFGLPSHDETAGIRIPHPIRGKLVAKWVQDMQRQFADADGAYDEQGGTAVVNNDDASTELSIDRQQWPTLLKDPAMNNNNLPPTEPTGPLHRLRMTILTNFAARCRAQGHAVAAGGGGDDDDPDSSSKTDCDRLCLRCARADNFVMRPQHGRLFLDGVLLPLSELLAYADMVLHVNTSVTERIFFESGLGNARATDPAYPWEDIKAQPIYEDYRNALVLATHCRRVFDQLPLAVDEETGLVKGLPVAGAR